MLCHYLNGSRWLLLNSQPTLTQSEESLIQMTLYFFTSFDLFSIWQRKAKLWIIQARQDVLPRQLIFSDAKFLLNPLI